MAKLKIEGVPPHDGDYDLDLAAFTGTELHTIKEISGVRGGELQEALEAGDYDLVVSFAVIVLRRAGRTVNPADIMEADVGAITVDLEADAVEEDRPLASSPTPNGNQNSDDVGSSSATSSEPSGPTSAITSADLQSGLSLTGNRG